MSDKKWAIGVDLGGTKIEVAQVDEDGKVQQRIRTRTDVKNGPDAVKAEIVDTVHKLQEKVGKPAAGVGIGVAGQIEQGTGTVRFAPNLDWHDLPLQKELHQVLKMPVVVTNDVRAATWGEWLHGAGKGCDDLVCVFVGTGIGGGVISGGKILTGRDNTAGEIGHITVDLHGPICHCGNQGCMEALAGGWAIARSAKEAVANDPKAGAGLIQLAGGQIEDITAKIVAQAAHEGDALAEKLVHEVAQALIAGAIGLVNAFNPERIIFGGGVMEGLPDLLPKIERGVHQRALSAATKHLQVSPAQLHNDAGVVGAAALAILTKERKG